MEFANCLLFSLSYAKCNYIFYQAFLNVTDSVWGKYVYEFMLFGRKEDFWHAVSILDFVYEILAQSKKYRKFHAISSILRKIRNPTKFATLLQFRTNFRTLMVQKVHLSCTAKGWKWSFFFQFSSRSVLLTFQLFYRTIRDAHLVVCYMVVDVWSRGSRVNVWACHIICLVVWQKYNRKFLLYERRDRRFQRPQRSWASRIRKVALKRIKKTRECDWIEAKNL